MQSGLQSTDIDTTATQRQVGDLQIDTLAQFETIRTLGGSADASFTFGVRASRPTAGAQGDRYFATDRQALYVYNGTAWQVVVGFDSGTDATRAAITPDATDNGIFYFTTDTGKLWEVSGGVWVDRFVDIAVTTSYKVGTVQVVKARKTGWGAPSGTLSRAAYASYAGQTISNPPTQAETQALDDAVKLLSQSHAALLTDLHGSNWHGLIGT